MTLRFLTFTWSKDLDFIFSSFPRTIIAPAFDLYFLPRSFPFPARTDFFFNAMSRTFFSNILPRLARNSFVFNETIFPSTMKGRFFSSESFKLEYFFLTSLEFAVALMLEIRAIFISFLFIFFLVSILGIFGGCARRPPTANGTEAPSQLNCEPLRVNIFLGILDIPFL